MFLKKLSPCLFVEGMNNRSGIKRNGQEINSVIKKFAYEIKLFEVTMKRT